MKNCSSFPPQYNQDARVLILGSMPGVASLKAQQYYAFKHNVFWRIMENIFNIPTTLAYQNRVAMLNQAGIALWDVLGGCEREGSLDSAIKEPQPNDIEQLLIECPTIELICCNGGASGRYLKRFFPNLEVNTITLPSTSPAAATISYQEKLEKWSSALSFIKE